MKLTELRSIIREVVTESIMGDYLEKNTDPKYKHFLDKRITFRDKSGKEYTGVAQFIGMNPVTKQYQVTAGGLPVWPVDPKTIQYAKPPGSLARKSIKKDNPDKYHIESVVMNESVSLDDIKKEFNLYDWYHDYSDDSRINNSGRAHREEIQTMIEDYLKDHPTEKNKVQKMIDDIISKTFKGRSHPFRGSHWVK